MTRVHRIFTLPDGEPRCVPMDPCHQKERCLRFRTPHGKNIPAADLSTSLVTELGCMSFLPLPEDLEAP